MYDTRPGEKKALAPATSDAVFFSKNVSIVVSDGAVFVAVDMTLLLPA
jgi:hypothetical protein